MDCAEQDVAWMIFLVKEDMLLFSKCESVFPSTILFLIEKGGGFLEK